MAKLQFDAIAGEIKAVDEAYTFSIFKNVADTAPEQITLDDFAGMVSSGEWSDVIGRIRAETDEDKQQVLKRKLPCVTVSGVFLGGHHASNMVKHSGLICLDFDSHDNPSMDGCAEAVRDKLSNDPFVKVAFVSARGNGVAAIVRIEPDRHGDAFDNLMAYFRKEHSLNIDRACRDVTRLRFVSWSDTRENQHARLFKRYSLVETAPATGPAPDANTQASAPTPEDAKAVTMSKARREEILSALERVSPDNRQTWLDVGMAIHAESSSLEGFNLWRVWSEMNDASGKYNEKDLTRVWKSFGKREGVRIETLFKMAYDTGWQGAPKERHTGGALPVLVAATWMLTPSKPRDPVIENVFDSGTFVEIIAPSKCRKSFFALQLANCVASGRKFLGWSVPRRRRVLLINVEILPDREHDRLAGMVRTLNLLGEDLERLLVCNIKGIELPDPVGAICATIRHEKPEVCIIDPLYLIHGEDENDQRAMTDVFRRISSVQVETNCTIIVVHHDAKGKAGDRDKRDRGSGSGIMGRFSDSRIILTPHKDNPEDLVCVETLCRYVPPQPGIVCRFVDGVLQIEESEECKPDTTKTTRVRVMKSDQAVEDAIYKVGQEIINRGPFNATTLHTMMGKEGLGLVTNYSLQNKVIDALKQSAMTTGNAFGVIEKGRSFWFGTPEKLAGLAEPKAYKD
jgi:hypothetical protein